MKTNYKYIEFHRDHEIWSCHRRNRRREIVGYIDYYLRVHKWEFDARTCLSVPAECLLDIADFLDRLNKGGKPK